MTTTSVKDVATVMGAMAANAANSVGNSSDVSFQSVWSEQAGKNPASEGSDTTVNESRKSDPREEVLKAKETVRKPVKDVSEKKTDETGMTEEQTEEAM